MVTGAVTGVVIAQCGDHSRTHTTLRAGPSRRHAAADQADLPATEPRPW
jgi:hypothetical protein